MNPEIINQNPEKEGDKGIKDTLILAGIIILSIITQTMIKQSGEGVNSIGFHTYMIGILLATTLSTTYYIPAGIVCLHYGVKGIMQLIGDQ